MIPLFIKMQTGYTIDYNHPGEDRCPNCGGKVYHVNEDDYIVFCTAMTCSWRDRTFYPKGVSYYEMQKRELRNLFEDVSTALDMTILKPFYKHTFNEMFTENLEKY